MPKVSRRRFLQGVGAGTLNPRMLGAGVLGAAAFSARSMPVHAGEQNVLRVGLVGCGGRGRGAAVNVLDADPAAKIVALGDAFAPITRLTAEGLREIYGDRVAVTPETMFDGLECYKGVIPCCDVVLLCQPPAFRPESLAAAVEAGKHVFCEKPVAVDAPGVKSVLESAQNAKERSLQLVSGLCWRYSPEFGSLIDRLRDGVVGHVSAARIDYLTGGIWTRPRHSTDTEMMAQVRNWYNFSWLSGDFNVEQHVHSIDMGLRMFNEAVPVAAWGMGARMSRTEQPAYGDIYDSMSVTYEFADGRTLYSHCRQQDGCYADVTAIAHGAKGTASLWGDQSFRDAAGTVLWKPDRSGGWKEVDDMRFLEQVALFKAIRSGGATYINDGEILANSTMTAILGREACYTGKRITWNDALAGEPIRPACWSWDADPPTLPDEKGRYKVPVPGMGRLYHSVVR